MIVSFANKCVFVAVPRTGTHAVRTALRPHLSPSDWEQCGRFETRVCPVPQIASIGHGHVPARLLRAALVPGLWEEMTCFAVLRDPLERFVSAFLLLHRDQPRDAIGALDAMKRVLADPDRMRHVLFRAQTEFVCDEQGEPMVGLLGRYEVLNADIAAIFTRMGLPAPALQRVNAAPYPQDFAPDTELRELVEHHYAADYALRDTRGEAVAL
tara:strand:+ start:217 stop:852 length:636 start_codon:yes stop_codon:yes gene_type:complete